MGRHADRHTRIPAGFEFTYLISLLNSLQSLSIKKWQYIPNYRKLSLSSGNIVSVGIYNEHQAHTFLEDSYQVMHFFNLLKSSNSDQNYKFRFEWSTAPSKFSTNRCKSAFDRMLF